MVTQQEVDEEWGQLSEDDASSREAMMLARYTELAVQEEGERRERLRAMANAEYALPDEKLRPFTISRMRTWLTLPPDQATVIADSYDAVMQQMPGPIAMRRVGLVQKLVMEFSAEEEERLRQLSPRVFAGAPGRLSVLNESRNSMSVDAPRKKAWWAFWRSS